MRVILTSHFSVARGLLAKDLLILNLGQVTGKTPELAPPSPNFHATPTGASTDLTCSDPLYTADLQRHKSRIHDTSATNPQP
ncbi:hypothetical protein TNCV_3501911 [Trichonephila clavipes]|uniref:Uncharacterized protein n=1 Tax=Trichonephila clavipes TaxID=2585209 RepID=A0A8X6RWC5_TRICX|nr:hypothetical protein TNCV_3501911 [Trichonephila clavipes]